MQLSEFNDSTFDSMVDEFIEEYWRIYPVRATYKGIHKYDHLLDDVSESAIDGFHDRQKEYAVLCEKFVHRGQLKDDNKIDLDILKGYLRTDPIYHDIFRRYYRDPSIYIGLATSACYILWLRDFAPKEQRYHSLAARLKAVPKLLSEAKVNLRKADFIPKVWFEVAKDMTASAQKFYSGTITNISKEIPALEKDLLSAGKLASGAIEDYLKFLNEELSAKPDGSFAAGRELYELLLKEVHMLPYNITQLEEIGLKCINDTIEKIKEISLEINPDKNWVEVVNDIKLDYPSAEELLNTYKNEIASTNNFILENDLVSIPDNESLEVIETPPFMRPILPYAGCMIPAPYEVDQRGFFLVTPIDTTASDKKQKEQLSGHNKPFIIITAIHEGYPGHHLQFCHANRVESKVRSLLGTDVFAEGWALYCEEMMKKVGYYQDKRIELIQLKGQLWRACRIVIDVRLHTGKFNIDDAVELLVKTACLEETNAQVEVKRYTQTPTQPMSYLIGKIEIERLLDDFQRQYADMTLKETHDQLLSYGTIPVALVRRAMLGTNLKKEC